MKTKLILLFFLVFSISKLSAQIDFDTSSEWLDILETADSTDKIIFIFLYAEWAGNCKRMEDRVFSNPEVASFYNKQFINVSIDIESDFGKSMSKVHKLKKVPALLFLNADEEELIKKEGALKEDKFLELGKAVQRSFAE